MVATMRVRRMIDARDGDSKHLLHRTQRSDPLCSLVMQTDDEGFNIEIIDLFIAYLHGPFPIVVGRLCVGEHVRGKREEDTIVLVVIAIVAIAALV